MCGIAGSISENSIVDLNILRCLQHRGPDEQSYYKDNNLILYHTRLSIVDIGEGHQPMKLDNKYIIVFNGEIYNHEELRRKYNLTCTTRSDTETLLQLYRKFGISFLHELDGMFAIALYDVAEQKLWLIRDRAGKKPLYYYHLNNQWFFASELNTLKRTLNLEIEPDYFYEYLRLGSFYRLHTPYKHVAELAAGSWLCVNISTNSYNQQQWWNIKDYYLKSVSTNESTGIAQFRDLLHQSVQRRVQSSDIEVACFLSGGIDSGLVASVAAKYTNKLKTFTIAFPGKYNEAPLAKLVADKIGSEHTEINIDFSDLKLNIENILSNYGEPFADSSAIPTWYVSKEAKKHVTVILTGDGADELFGGYRRHVPFSKYNFFSSSSAFKSFVSLAYNLLPVSHDKKNVYNYIYRLGGLIKNNELDVYMAASADIFEGYINKAFIQTDSRLFSYMKQDIKNDIEGLKSGLKKILIADFNISLFSTFLVKMDIGTMHHALESRSPFLSKEILEWAPSISDSLKINGKTTKYLLRQFAKETLPAELIYQPKRGFEVPLKQWIEGDLEEIIHSYIFSQNAFSKNFVKTSFIKSVWDKKIIIGDEKRAKMLWTLFAMEIWYHKSYLT